MLFLELSAIVRKDISGAHMDWQILVNEGGNYLFLLIYPVWGKLLTNLLGDQLL